jgi:hypothetical protein
MNLEQMAQALEDAGVGVQKKTLFINRLPVTVPTGILLKTTTAGTPIDWELPGFFRGKFQAIVRDPDFTAGAALAQQVSDALTFDETQLDGIYVKYVRPRNLPVAFPVNDADLIEFSINFDICFVLTP